MMNIKNNYWLLALLILISIPVYGQGWERHYTEPGTTPQSEISAITPDPTGGFLMLFSQKDINGTGAANTDIFIQKTNEAGQVQQTTDYDWGENEAGLEVVSITGGGFAVLYEVRAVNTPYRLGLLHLDNALQEVSHQILNPGPQFVSFYGATMTESQGNIHILYNGYDTTVVSQFGGGYRVIETIVDAAGNVVSHTPLLPYTRAKDVVLASNNDRVALVIAETGDQWGLTRIGANPWTTIFSGPGISQYYYGGAVVHAPGGGYYACLAAGGIPAITKLDDNGAYQWQKIYPSHPDSLNIVNFVNVVPVADGSGYWASGFEAGAEGRLIIIRLDPQCNRMWSKALGAGTFHNQYYPLYGLPDNGVITGGSNGLYWDNFHKVAFRLDANGETFNAGISGVVYRDSTGDCAGDYSAANAGLEVRAWQNGLLQNVTRVDNQGAYQMAMDTGDYKITVEKINQAWFYCTDSIPVTVNLNTTSTGVDFVNYYNPSPFDSIYGYVFRDIDGDCTQDSFETQGFAGWTLHLHYSDGVNTVNLTTTSDANGYYVFPAIPGIFNTGSGYVIAEEPAGNGLNCNYTCYSEQLFNFHLGNSVQLDFARHCDSMPPCPQMEVDIATWGLRPCLTSVYGVNYCNTGLEAATNAYVEIAFDSSLVVVESTIPWSSVNNHVYRFELGTVASDLCGHFEVTVFVPCTDSAGTTYCTTAHIFPDSSCVSPQFWDGSEVQVTAVCTGDSVIFTIQNVGSAAMTQAQEYVVIEDNVLFMSVPGQFQLGVGESTQVVIPANGSFFRLEAEQSAGFPGLGNPVAWAEGCGGTGNVSLGFVNQYPLGDEDPWLDVFCAVSANSFDPNDKTGFPIGVKEDHFIRENTELEYLIRFQNTGTADALYVEVRDTLPVAFLNPATVRPGASSHQYEWDIQGSGVVVFRFPNINLPDINTDEAGSQGFVKFRVSQRRDLPVGTVIRNDAFIYFDNNAPVQTNQTWHTIGEDFLSKTAVVYVPGMQVSVQPNPAKDYTRIVLEGLPAAETELKVVLRSALGVVVLEESFVGTATDVQLAGIPAGVYFYEISGGKGAIVAGKVVIYR